MYLNDVDTYEERKDSEFSQQNEVSICLKDIQQNCVGLFTQMAHKDAKEALKVADFVGVSSKVVTNKSYFLLGLYIGSGGIILLALGLLIALNVNSTVPSQHTSFDYVFPMFRGVGLFILYLWGMAWNVYGFTQYRINFRAILEFGGHYSTSFEIMKRAGFFTLVFVAMMLLYLIGLSLSNTFLPLEYTPFVVWALYFAYIFFPNRQVFNPRGRQYFYDLVKHILLSPWTKTTFVLSYATDQMVSFVIPIKDLAYTVCYYTSSLSEQTQSYKDCLNSNKIDGILIAYIVALIPLAFRMIQCYKASNGHFYKHLQMYNFFKYFASVVTVSLSFFSTYAPNMALAFVVSSVVSTLYSYYWDLKYDWGFLRPGCRLLRSHLAYGNRRFYYTALCVNLLLRFSWTLTLAPSIINILPKATFLPFLTGFLQIFRRCLWNFFRVEKEHVLNCESYTVVKMTPQQVIEQIRKPVQQLDKNHYSAISYAQIDLKSTFLGQKNCLDIEQNIVLQFKDLFSQALLREKDYLSRNKVKVQYDFDFRDKYH